MSAQDTTVERLEPVPNTGPDATNFPNLATATADTAVIAEEPPRRTSPWLALQHRDFRLLWTGGFVSQAGSQMSIVAIAAQLWDLTHDPAAVGLQGLFRMLPLLAFSLFGGVIADALDRRKLLILTQATMATASLILAASTYFGWVSPIVIYLATALAASATAFDNPARSALTPNLVPRSHLPNALSLNIIMWQVATIVGPVLAGVLLPLRDTGYTIIYTVDGVSFVAVIVALYFIRTRTQDTITRNVSFRSALEGLSFLRKTPIIMATMTLDFFATFFGAAMVLIPAFSEQVLHVDRQFWGILYAAPAIGAVAAGLVMSALGNVPKQGLIVLVSVAAYGLATVLFGLSTAFWLTVLALAGTGAADTVSMVMRQTIRQLSTPDELRGRMTSVNMLFYIGGPQLGELEAGILGSAIGIGPAVVLGGLAVIVVTAFTGFFVPTLRNYDRHT